MADKKYYRVLCKHFGCGGETIITEHQYQWQEKVRCSKCRHFTQIDTDSEIVKGVSNG